MLIDDYSQEEASAYMVIQEAIHEGSTILHLSGSLDVTARAAFTDIISKVQASGTTSIILDLTEVKFIDSAALGFLNLAAGSSKQSGIHLSVAQPQDNVRKVLDLVNLQKTIPIFSNLDDALSR